MTHPKLLIRMRPYPVSIPVINLCDGMHLSIPNDCQASVEDLIKRKTIRKRQL